MESFRDGMWDNLGKAMTLLTIRLPSGPGPAQNYENFQRKFRGSFACRNSQKTPSGARMKPRSHWHTNGKWSGLLRDLLLTTLASDLVETHIWSPAGRPRVIPTLHFSVHAKPWDVNRRNSNPGTRIQWPWLAWCVCEAISSRMSAAGSFPKGALFAPRHRQPKANGTVVRRQAMEQPSSCQGWHRPRDICSKKVETLAQEFKPLRVLHRTNSGPSLHEKALAWPVRC